MTRDERARGDIARYRYRAWLLAATADKLDDAGLSDLAVEKRLAAAAYNTLADASEAYLAVPVDADDTTRSRAAVALNAARGAFRDSGVGLGSRDPGSSDRYDPRRIGGRDEGA